MYPNTKYPYYGTFVKQFKVECDRLGFKTRLSVLTKTNNFICKICKYMLFFSKTFILCIFQKNDIVYVHYPSYSSLGVLLACKIRKINIYANLHGSDVLPATKLQEKMIFFTKALLKNSKKIVVPSEYYKELVLSRFEIKKSDIYVYPSGGVNQKIFYQFNDITELKEKYGIDNNSFTISFVSRVTKDKGWDTFLRIVKKLIDDDYKVNAIMVGDGDQNKQRDILLHEFDLENKVMCLGLQPQNILSEIYNVSDLFCFPTRRKSESLGLVGLEAMSCGTPVISSDFAAPKFYVKNDVNGWKFPPDNYYIAVQFIEDVIDGKIDIERLRRGSIETASQYSEDTVLARLNDILSD